jgi:hypothetical protein
MMVFLSTVIASESRKSCCNVPRLIVIPVTKVGLGSYVDTVSEDHLRKFLKARDSIS